MKTFIKSNYFPALLATALGLMPMGQVTALTLTTVHSFTATSACCPSTNSDGAFPEAPLVFSSNVLYGTTTRGGGSDNGTVFRVNTDGTAFATLHSFTALTSSSPRINSDGANPQGGLVSSGNMLYGTASQGGSLGWGTVVKVDTDGNGVTTLHNFAGYPADGGAPYAALIISGNTLYGTTYQGGRWNAGTVFKLNTDGTGFTNLYDFPTSLGPSPATNADGANPAARLTLSGSTLYGTARFGGGFGGGTVFALQTNGTAFTTLHNFAGYPSDGSCPFAGLVLSGNTLYGTAAEGGSSGNGTLFAVNTDGTAFTNLHTFTATSGCCPATNGDGAIPYAGLVLLDNTLYGTARIGGKSENGTAFKVRIDGTVFANLYNFTAPSGPYSTNGDGSYPDGGLILSGNTLYGTAYSGGISARGTVFSLSLPVPPQLTIVHSDASVILMWPTNTDGFSLQSTTNLDLPASWTAVFPGPAIVNGQNAVTNPISGTRQFYRLSQ